MNILLSNDDGIMAPGLAALRAAVSDMGDITVVAPDSPQSASGHAITLKHPLTVRRVEVGPVEGICDEAFSGMSVDGRPADCVRLAIGRLMPTRAALVLSGINAGSNVGINVFYSGTVAAAAEAAMLGVAAVAFSVALADGQADFAAAGRIARWVLGQLTDGGLAPGDLINVNIPSTGGGRVPCGVRVVRQSTAGLEDRYHRCDDDRQDAESYRLGDDYTFLGDHRDTDVAALDAGYITITPLHVDMTNHDRLANMARSKWPAPPK